MHPQHPATKAASGLADGTSCLEKFASRPTAHVVMRHNKKSKATLDEEKAQQHAQLVLPDDT
ncbi:hypothetical protein [Xylella taiwanensis]|uniref:hypothetical protein n=1 Tax=Xylella taiwanensis TaxID=1444770 RepID=UPI0013626420|nr:hypothetical protein [Xylella taiwanensis]UFM94612.1 hypothetical protein LPH39_05050 [Xylella taiwanensis]UFN14541.1 hypothetical protein LPH61_04900 [Xylella taiwanensis]